MFIIKISFRIKSCLFSISLLIVSNDGKVLEQILVGISPGLLHQQAHTRERDLDMH